MNILSLFDGISCGQLALNKAGIKIDKYYSSEIDKNAIKVTMSNFPDTIQLGDITKISTKALPEIDLLIGGSPCQGFSFAGKQLNFSDIRSKLFFEYVRILRELKIKNPNLLFLLENVRMKKEYQDVISTYLGVQPIMINSSLVSAQNRVRLYWTNIENVSLPIDKEILLQDILEDGLADREKSYCIDSSYWKGGNINQYFNKSRRQLVFKDLLAYGVAQRGRNTVNNKRKDILHATTKQRIEVNITGKSNCLTSASKDSMVYKNGLVRKLTPIECERLQTIPDNYTNFVSDSQRYKMLGNGWTVDIIVGILKNINTQNEKKEEKSC